jgi:hypothetical protein
MRRDKFRHGCRDDFVVVVLRRGVAAAAQIGREESLDFFVERGLRLDAWQAADVQSASFVLGRLPVRRGVGPGPAVEGGFVFGAWTEGKN